MPPKKKGKKSSKKGKKSSKSTKPTVTGLYGPTEEMSKEELEEQIVRLREELDRDREERNYFQLERDKIHTFWEITKRQLEEKKADLRNKERELEESEERHQVEIRAYKQKVKHLLYEHQNSISEQKVEGVVSIRAAHKEHADMENELRKGMRNLRMDIKEHEMSGENMIKSLKMKHDEEMTKVKYDFEREVREIEKKYEEKMQALRQELDLRRKTEVHEIEERKNSHINTLMTDHEDAFRDMKNYYNSITLNSLTLINSLKKQLEDGKKKEHRLEKEMTHVLQENRQLTESLQEAREEVSDLQRQMANYKKDKASLAGAKVRLKVADKEMKNLKWEHEVLEQRFSKVQGQRDELYDKFTKAILEVQQKSGFRNMLLEKKLSVLSKTLENKEAQLSEVSTSSPVQPELKAESRLAEDV